MGSRTNKNEIWKETLRYLVFIFHKHIQLAWFETFHFHIWWSVAYLKLFVFLSFQFSRKDDLPASIRWEDWLNKHTWNKTISWQKTLIPIFILCTHLCVSAFSLVQRKDRKCCFETRISPVICCKAYFSCALAILFHFFVFFTFLFCIFYIYVLQLFSVWCTIFVLFLCNIFVEAE